MKPKIRTALNRLERRIESGGDTLRSMARELRNAGNDLPSEFAELHEAVAKCKQCVERLSEKLDAVYEADRTLREHWWDKKTLSDAEVSQLLALNRRLRDIDPLLKSIAKDVEPRLEAKLADPNDPMYDYEIEARLDFILREDDPDYSEDDDNILTTRRESLRHQQSREHTDYAESICPENLRAEPHCWRFHDLYDHAYGEDAPSLSFRDCLRVGRVFIDVEVWQQYDFELAAVSTAELPDIDVPRDNKD